jgi:hypothetical protein
MTFNRAVQYMREQRAIEEGRQSKPFIKIQLLFDDPETLAEARAVVDRERASPPVADLDDIVWHGGMLSGLLLPALSRAIYAPEIPTVEEMRASARFEFYGFARLGLTYFLFPLAALLVLLSLACIINRVGFGRRDDDVSGSAGWPSAAYVAAAALGFTLPAAIAMFLMPKAPGSMYQVWFGAMMADAWGGSQLIARQWALWTIFCFFWGQFLSWNLLILLANRSATAALPPVAPSRWSRNIPRIVWGGLILSVAIMAFPLLFTPEPPGESQTIVAFALLAPAFLNMLFHWIGILANASAVSRARSRRLLAGVAGGLLLWCGVYAWVAERERHWAARETVMLPNVINGRVMVFTPIEGRIVERYREHAARILADERDNSR